LTTTGASPQEPRVDDGGERKRGSAEEEGNCQNCEKKFFFLEGGGIQWGPHTELFDWENIALLNCFY